MARVIKHLLESLHILPHEDARPREAHDELARLESRVPAGFVSYLDRPHDHVC